MAWIAVVLLSSYDTFIAEKVGVLDGHTLRWRRGGVNVSQQLSVGVELEKGARLGRPLKNPRNSRENRAWAVSRPERTAEYPLQVSLFGKWKLKQRTKHRTHTPFCKTTSCFVLFWHIRTAESWQRSSKRGALCWQGEAGLDGLGRDEHLQLDTQPQCQSRREPRDHAKSISNPGLPLFQSARGQQNLLSALALFHRNVRGRGSETRPMSLGSNRAVNWCSASRPAPAPPPRHRFFHRFRLAGEPANG